MDTGSFASTANFFSCRVPWVTRENDCKVLPAEIHPSLKPSLILAQVWYNFHMFAGLSGWAFFHSRKAHISGFVSFCNERFNELSRQTKFYFLTQSFMVEAPLQLLFLCGMNSSMKWNTEWHLPHTSTSI